MYFPEPKLTAARKITRKALEGYADIDAAIAELEADNERIGASDGRVTQIIYLQEAKAEMVSNDEKRRELERKAAVAESVRRYEAELAHLNRRYAGDRYGDRILEKAIVWEDEDGHQHTRRYTTERGFLKALIRLLRADVYIHRAD